jgi:hypothetical protein
VSIFPVGFSPGRRVDFNLGQAGARCCYHRTPREGDLLSNLHPVRASNPDSLLNPSTTYTGSWWACIADDGMVGPPATTPDDAWTALERFYASFYDPSQGDEGDLPTRIASSMRLVSNARVQVHANDEREAYKAYLRLSRNDDSSEARTAWRAAFPLDAGLPDPLDTLASADHDASEAM